jgi:hypothetical protein
MFNSFQTDVIVVCSSSEYLFDSICKAGGDSIKASFDAESKNNLGASVIAVKAEGQLSSKMIYFLPWKKMSDESLLRTTLGKFVSDAIEKAVTEKYKSIAFPAIGCGEFGCSISHVAQAMVEKAYIKLQSHAISISFVIQPERTDIHDEFQKQINILQLPTSPPPSLLSTSPLSRSFSRKLPSSSKSSSGVAPPSSRKTRLRQKLSPELFSEVVPPPSSELLSGASLKSSSRVAPPPPLSQLSLILPLPAEQVKKIDVTVNKGIIEVEKGDITTQNVCI